MGLIIAILSLLAALVPIADRGIQNYQQHRQEQQVRQLHTALRPVSPPDVNQGNVVFYRGEWWKYENGSWLVWRQNTAHLAQGGSNVRR